MWPAQIRVLRSLRIERLLTVLKARQLGLSWLVLCFLLWSMLFLPEAAVLIFSKRDDEAIDLLDSRLKGIYSRLPDWLQDSAVYADSQHDFGLANGSTAKAFPTTGGRSYTGSIVLVDEADFVQDLDGLMNAVKPTIDAGGQMILISTVDKSKPASPFKRIYRAARKGESDWHPIFLSWRDRPGRDDSWYAAQLSDIMSRTGAEDDLHQEYPETDTQALAPRTLDKRIPSAWINDCFVEMSPQPLPPGAPSLPRLEIYRAPEVGHTYALGIDPAEGNPTSDDSAITVMDAHSGEECASIAGKFQPSVLAGYADQLGHYYNDAAVMVERNNHGHAVLLWLEEHSTLRRLPGHDEKDGWLSNHLGKTLLYNDLADAFRDGNTLLHSFDSYGQIANVEGSTLRAPDGDFDDRADAYALARVGSIAALSDPAALRQGAVQGRPPPGRQTGFTRTATRRIPA